MPKVHCKQLFNCSLEGKQEKSLKSLCASFEWDSFTKGKRKYFPLKVIGKANELNERPQKMPRRTHLGEWRSDVDVQAVQFLCQSRCARLSVRSSQVP